MGRLALPFLRFALRRLRLVYSALARWRCGSSGIRGIRGITVRVSPGVGLVRTF